MSNFSQQLNEIKESLTEEDIISIVTEGLHSDDYTRDPSNNLIFSTKACHNGDSNKLFYYSDSKVFVCYTHCGKIGDIFNLVQHSLGLSSVWEAYRFVCNFLGIKTDTEFYGFVDFPTEKVLTDDWGILEKFDSYKNNNRTIIETPFIPKTVLSLFDYSVYPQTWVEENISIDAMQKFNIGVDYSAQKIIIPHYDLNDNLIGIRGRSLNPVELDKGMKYAPIWVEQQCYRHSLGEHFYGLNKNKETIRNLGKVCVVEGEKSVLLSETYYPDNNFTVATCGSSGISKTQLDILLSLGVKEVIIGYDKENDEDPNSEQTKAYERKILNIAQPLTTYFDVYVLFDYGEVLNHKDSPFDKGKDVLEELMRNKYYVSSIFDPKLERRKNKIFGKI